MKTTYTAAAALLLSSTSVFAVGLDRSNQDITAIFEDGNYVELSYGRAMPDVGGADLGPLAPGAPVAQYEGVGQDFSQIGLSLTYQVNPQVSAALIIDQPYGVDVVYPGSGATSLLGGTSADLSSTAITAIGRYKFDDNFSAHAGIRSERLDADITLSGLAYGGLNGYNTVLEGEQGFGYLIGAAYERPEIALRVALTYHSSISHEFDTVESINGTVVNPGSTTTVDTPEAWNIDFQSGVAEDTLVFGQIRYARYEQTLVSPAVFASQTGGASLTNIESNTSYSIGVARRFSDQFAGTVAFGYENGRNELVSPLAPTNGNRSLTLGGQYTQGDMVFSGGVRFTDLGDALPQTAGTPRATFNDNTAISVGLSVGYNF